MKYMSKIPFDYPIFLLNIFLKRLCILIIPKVSEEQILFVIQYTLPISPPPNISDLAVCIGIYYSILPNFSTSPISPSFKNFLTHKMEERRTRLLIHEKKEILDYLELNKEESHASIASKFSIKFKKKISRRSILDFKKNKEKIIDAYCKTGSRKNSLKHSKYQEIDDSLYQWILMLESKGGIYNEKIIKQKAIEISDILNISDFTASNGWIYKFKKRFNIAEKNICGESLFIKKENFNEFISDFKERIKNYLPKNIFNCDETSLFYKLIPSKGHVAGIRKGVKRYKDRISILLCTNMDGTEKLSPLIIGKFGKPRCFAGFNANDFCDYMNNTKAWMTSDFFGRWLLKWSSVLKKQNRKILLILDNCTSHNIKFKIDNIDLLYLPKNSSPVLQPLDAGIIKSFKSKFYKYELSNVLSKIDSCVSVEEIYKKITIKDAIIYTSWAWRDISSVCINNCWNHTSLIKEKEDADFLGDEENINELIEDLNLEEPLDQHVFYDDFNIDNEIIIDDANNFILENLKDINNNDKYDVKMETKITDDKIIEEFNNDNENLINVDEAMAFYYKLKGFVYNESDGGKVNYEFQKIENFLIKKKRKRKFEKISDYFIKK